MKPGWKTTEFWLSAIVTIIGLIVSSGIVTEGSGVERIIGLVAAALASMGYTASRANVKKSEGPPQ